MHTVNSYPISVDFVPSKNVYVCEHKKKWKNKAFASGANRDEMIEGARSLGIDLWEHVSNVLTAMQSIAAEISLDGSVLLLE